jgi:hypothetical protein
MWLDLTDPQEVTLVTRILQTVHFAYLSFAKTVTKSKIFNSMFLIEYFRRGVCPASRRTTYLYSHNLRIRYIPCIYHESAFLGDKVKFTLLYALFTVISLEGCIDEILEKGKCN